jgi:hypothetical protein
MANYFYIVKIRIFLKKKQQPIGRGYYCLYQRTSGTIQSTQIDCVCRAPQNGYRENTEIQAA